ncbi:MAG: hypothetical protein EON93_23065 [Burkholderiales bacterium]|nr:MAG: hypothetical protein EON93_23065 [Burkholderiales bacterium]
MLSLHRLRSGASLVVERVVGPYSEARHHEVLEDLLDVVTLRLAEGRCWRRCSRNCRSRHGNRRWLLLARREHRRGAKQCHYEAETGSTIHLLVSLDEAHCDGLPEAVAAPAARA